MNSGKIQSSPLAPFYYSGLAGLSISARNRQIIRVGGKTLQNFASSDYLGLGSHPLVVMAACRAMQRWGFSMGMPAVIAIPELARCVETQFSRLTGQERALLLPSTTHIAQDLLPGLAGDGDVIFIDDWAYPISLDGARAAQQRGARLVRFVHNDPAGLEKTLRVYSGARRKLIVVDGVYSAGGICAPLGALNHLAERYGALIYVDDAHGIGILGGQRQIFPPYGTGGSGTPANAGVPPGRILHVASLAKAFGVPLALAAGTSSLIEPLRQRSEALLHSSPPAVPVIAAALAGLLLNERIGDCLRARLSACVRWFVQVLSTAGCHLSDNGFFPIQSIYYPTAQAALQAGARLRKAGLLPIVNLYPLDHPGGGVIRFLLTTNHTAEDLRLAAGIIRAKKNGTV